MSEPREPCFEEDFDCDTDPPDHWTALETTIEDIAIMKGHAHAKHLDHPIRYAEVKNAYEKGFLEGVAFRMGGCHGDAL